MIKTALRKVVSRKTISRFKIRKDYSYYANYIKEIEKETEDFDYLIGTPIHANLGDHFISIAEIEFLTRAPKRQDLDDINDWVRDCAKAAAIATRTEVEMFLVGAPFHELHISEIGKGIMESCFDDLGMTYEKGKSAMTGSSDIGNVDYRCPAFHPIIGIGKQYDAHTKEFAEEMTCEGTHQAIKDAAAYLLTLAAKLYTDRALLDRLKADHKAYRGY